MPAIALAVSPRAKSQRKCQRLRSTGSPSCPGSVARVRQRSDAARDGCIVPCLAFYLTTSLQRDLVVHILQWTEAHHAAQYEAAEARVSTRPDRKERSAP